MQITPAVRNLLIANGLVYLFQMVFGTVMVKVLGLRPVAIWSDGLFYQVVTYMFLHGGFWHLLMNMFALWMFGSTLEAVWGSQRFYFYYFLTGIGAGLCNVLLTPMSPIPIIGASGAVYGILAAYALYFPNNPIYIWGILPIKAKWLVLIYGAMAFFGSFNSGSGIAHIVHLGGMVIGVIYLTKHIAIRWIKSKYNAVHTKTVKMEVRYNRDWKQKERERLQGEIDELLDRINQVGERGLTRTERQRLDNASRRLIEIEEED